MGAGQQITLVVPETGTVIVRLGPPQVEVEEWKPNFSIINALAGAVGGRPGR